jgi:hypothetical protein
MPGLETAQALSAAHLEVQRARDLLTTASPQSLEASSNALAQAIADLKLSRQGMKPGVKSPERLSQMRQLRGELQHTGRLLESAAQFYRGWERILGSMSSGYTPGDEPAPVARTGKLFCEG